MSVPSKRRLATALADQPVPASAARSAGARRRPGGGCVAEGGPSLAGPNGAGTGGTGAGATSAPVDVSVADAGSAAAAMPPSYRGLRVWQRALELAAVVHRLSRGFPRVEQYGLTLQLR